MITSNVPSNADLRVRTSAIRLIARLVVSHSRGGIQFDELSKGLALPDHSIEEIVLRLVQRGLVIQTENHERRFALACAPSGITIHDITTAMTGIEGVRD